MSIFDINLWLSLLTLTLLEIILGIDNLVFISIISHKLPQHQQKAARRFGLALALVTRLLLLATATWIASLTHPLLSILTIDFSARDLLLIGGGLFLLIKATSEIHGEVEEHDEKLFKPKYTNVITVIIQISLLDIIFSLDSVITAVGMTSNFIVMAIAIVIAVILMLIASEPLSDFIKRHTTIKILALSFLILVGMVLIADGLHFHIPRGYLYFAIAFSIFVESLNIFIRKRKRVNNKKLRKKKSVPTLG